MENSQAASKSVKPSGQTAGSPPFAGNVLRRYVDRYLIRLLAVTAIPQLLFVVLKLTGYSPAYATAVQTLTVLVVTSACCVTLILLWRQPLVLPGFIVAKAFLYYHLVTMPIGEPFNPYLARGQSLTILLVIEAMAFVTSLVIIFGSTKRSVAARLTQAAIGAAAGFVVVVVVLLAFVSNPRHLDLRDSSRSNGVAHESWRVDYGGTGGLRCQTYKIKRAVGFVSYDEVADGPTSCGAIYW